jgi:hypothetical protein
LHRSSTTPVAPLANTAMLDEPAVVAAADMNAKSSKVTPIVTASEYPDAGATVALSPAL